MEGQPLVRGGVPAARSEGNQRGVGGLLDPAPYHYGDRHDASARTPSPLSGCSAPAPQGDAGPDELDHAERPCSGEEPVDAGQKAAKSEQEDELSTSPFEGIHDHHERDGTDSIDGDTNVHSASQAGCKTFRSLPQ